MPLPYQFRDYPLALFMSIVILVSLLVGIGEEDYQAVEITFSDNFLAAEHCPVVASLVHLPRANRIRRHTQEGLTVVSLQTSRRASATKIWETIEAAKCSPLRMVVDNREFVTKPTE